MAAGRVFQYLHKMWLSKPTHEREIYAWIRANQPTKLVEIGIADSRRTQSILNFAQQYSPDQTIEFLGIDMFEGRENRDGISLKSAHSQMARLNIKAKLVPGTASMALPRVANGFRDADLVIISADQSRDDVLSSMSWLPRMIEDESLVLWESSDKGRLSFKRYSKTQIEALAVTTSDRRLAA